jgi:hypothetical protein
VACSGRGYDEGVRFIAVISLATVVLVGGAQATGSVSSSAADPPVLVPWNRVGGISLGESSTAVYRSYGKANFHRLQRWGYLHLHASRVLVTFYGGRVGEIGFTSAYYRTSGGFGVGSVIPLGPCYRTATRNCEHRWHGFLYNEWNKGTPCNCWVKVGTHPTSLAVSVSNFEKPWFFIYTKHGRATYFYFALRYVD